MTHMPFQAADQVSILRGSVQALPDAQTPAEADRINCFLDRCYRRGQLVENNLCRFEPDLFLELGETIAVSALGLDRHL